MENTFQFNTITKAIHYLKQHQTEQPTLEEVAKHVHLSKYHFQRLFTTWAGVSPKDFLQYLTLEQAKRSLQKGQSTLQTAYEVGLSGNGRLHDLFIKMEACTPGEFKKRGQGLAIYYDKIDTPFGISLITETNKRK